MDSATYGGNEMTSTTADLIRNGMHPAEAGDLDRDDAIALIREALKTRSGKPWSVTGGRGTAWGWIEITAPPKRRVAHEPNPAWNRKTVGPASEGSIDANGNPPHFEVAPSAARGGHYMSEADCAELAALLGLSNVSCQGVSIPAASDYRREYVARARGLAVLDHGRPYWD